MKNTKKELQARLKGFKVTTEKDNNYINKLATELDKTPTRARLERVEKAILYLENEQDSGRYGRVEELLAATTYSQKNRVSLQGKADSFLRWKNDNGTIVNRPFERKTNGGRIGELVRRLEKGKDTLLVYSMDICNSTTKGKRRLVEPVLVWFSNFYNMLEEINGLKNTNGKNPEIAIQVSKIDLYNRLLDYPIPYDPDTVYSQDDLEDLPI